MYKTLILFIALIFYSTAVTQEAEKLISIKGLAFLEGKWKAYPTDSSFFSILKYEYSPEGKLLMATNHLYGKDGQLFRNYEGAYFVDVDKFNYFLSGPHGEVHKGMAFNKNDTLTHLAIINPGKSIKSYKSQMLIKDGKLYYYANYSKKLEYPKDIDYTNPLIYKKLEEIEIPTPEEYQKIAYLIGDWKSEFGKDLYAKMNFSWGDNKRMIKFQTSNRRSPNQPEQLETNGMITYHGTKNKLVFLTTYMQKGGHLISEGYYEIDDKGVIHRPFTCHYKAGDKLPWSDGAVAPKGGKSIEFKQIWTPIDNNSFRGQFFWKKDGKWINPMKGQGQQRPKIVWKRVNY